MKHGPLALVDETMRIVVVATRDSMYAKMVSSRGRWGVLWGILGV